MAYRFASRQPKNYCRRRRAGGATDRARAGDLNDAGRDVIGTDIQGKTNALAESVLAREPSVAVFDCDGTIWAIDAGVEFFQWTLQRGMVARDLSDWSRQQYAGYLCGTIGEEAICAVMTTIHRGLPDAELHSAADEFFRSQVCAHVFPEMTALIEALKRRPCEMWLVSASNQWVIEAAARYLDIPTDHVLAAQVEVIDGMVTDRLVRVPCGAGKVDAIAAAAKCVPDIAFGNSRWDEEMLTYARRGYAINPTADFAATACARGWDIFLPSGISTQS